MKRFKTEVTRVVYLDVELDEDYFNEAWFEVFREYFYDFYTLEELTKYVAKHAARDWGGFIEGIGQPLYDGEVSSLLSEKRAKQVVKAINITSISGNDQGDVEVEETY